MNRSEESNTKPLATIATPKDENNQHNQNKIDEFYVVELYERI
jgi:hypothetical protein